MLSKGALDAAGKGIALAALLFTAGSYVYDLSVDREAGRYAAAVRLMERYRNTGIRDAETQLQRQMLYYRAGGLDPNSSLDFSDEMFAEIANEVFFGETGAAENVRAPYLPRLTQIVDFYGEVAFCQANTICDAEILDKFFCPRASAFFQQNARLLDAYSVYSGTEEWKHDLDQMVARCLD